MKNSVWATIPVVALAAMQVSGAVTSQDMGTATVRGSQVVTQTLTFTGMPASPSFSIAFGRDYSVQSHSCSGGSCSVVVAFAPQFPGLSEDALVVKDGSGNLLATTLLHGIGLGPQSAFHPGVINTFAGTGTWGYSGDGSNATAANLSAPQGLAIDPLGNVYIADSVNQIVRKVTTGGIITTVAGTPGSAGYTGDGGAATRAELNAPAAVALDGAGNLFIADSGNNCIREVSALTGTITTVAGGGTSASQTDGLGDGGPATAAILSVPSDIAVSPEGELYIADTDDGLIRKVDASGVIWIVAGGGSATGSDGFGDGGPATSASLQTPSGVTLDPLGNLYIADTGHGLVRYVVSGTINVFAAFNRPYGIRLDAAGDLYMADYADSIMGELAVGSTTVSVIAGSNGTAGYAGDNQSPLTAQLSNPTALALDPDGNLYVADYGNNRVRKITFTLQNMTFATTYAGESSAPQTETLFNIGNRALSVIGLSISSGFSQQASGATDCATNVSIQEGTDCVLSMVLNSANAGSITGTLSLTSNSLNQSGTSASATLSGTALATTGSVQISPSTVSFGHVGEGLTSSAQTVTISNTGSNTLTEQSISLTGVNASAFAFNNIQCGQTLAAQSQCTLQVTFTPTTPASYTASITASYTGAVAVSASLTGTGDAPQANISPGALSFGTIGQGVTSTAQTVTLTNPSNADLTIASVSLSDAADFAINATTCGGTLAPGLSCTVSVSFTPSSAGAITGSLVITDSVGAQSVSLSGTALQALEFIPITPCRVVDTRNVNGSWGGPSIPAQGSRDFPIAGSACNIPATAAAYSFNLTVVPQGFLGYVTLWPTGEAQPLVSNINSLDGRVKAVAAIIPAGVNGSISAYAYNKTDIVLDINGYFVPKGTANALAFYPVSPCRVLDTRSADSPLGGPSMTAGESRDFPILSSSCEIPSTARAYALNVTAVPPAELGYITTWPTGQPQPYTSILNDLTGTVVANANLAPAGDNGAISVFAQDDTNLILDINGYFAPAGTGGYSFFTLSPCRVLDTRGNPGSPVTQLTIDIAGSSCGAPVARAYAVSATVIPSGFLGYISLWPYGESQPLVSTLNALDGSITSNLAIVPATDGKISFFGYNPTHLLIDVFGFFE